MTEFPELRAALSEWRRQVLGKLLSDSRGRYQSVGRSEWAIDHDSIFRDRPRAVESWAPFILEMMTYNKSSWNAVMAAIHNDVRLARQLNTLVGTAHGGAARVEPQQLFTHVLPRPAELDSEEEAFDRRYAQLEHYLKADEFEYVTVLPLPGMAIASLPIELEPDVELDAMSDRELAFALNTSIIRPMFPGIRILDDEAAKRRTCLRYRFRSPKTLGEDQLRSDSSVSKVRKNAERLTNIKSAFEESIALVLAEPVTTAGAITVISDSCWHPRSGGVSWAEATMPRAARFRRIDVNENQVNEFLKIWGYVRKPGLLGKQKGLALALRRLSYQAQRERAEDELLDIMIGAEALYLTDLGNEQYRGELRYRLSLRSAMLNDAAPTSLTKQEVFELMKSAYDARSAIAHGGRPKPKVLKFRGSQVSLADIVAATRGVVTASCCVALERAASDVPGWPPDWEALIFGAE
jgi:hypothetical protein